MNDAVAVDAARSYEVADQAGGPSTSKPDSHQRTDSRIARSRVNDGGITQPAVNSDDVGLECERSGDVKPANFDESDRLASSQKPVSSPEHRLTYQPAVPHPQCHTALPAVDLPFEENSEDLPGIAQLHHPTSQPQTSSSDSRPSREEALVDHKPFHYRVNSVNRTKLRAHHIFIHNCVCS